MIPQAFQTQASSLFKTLSLLALAGTFCLNTSAALADITQGGNTTTSSTTMNNGVFSGVGNGINGSADGSVINNSSTTVQTGSNTNSNSNANNYSNANNLYTP